MLQLVVGKGGHALYAPSSALLMAKAVQSMHMSGLCALQSSSWVLVIVSVISTIVLFPAFLVLCMHYFLFCVNSSCFVLQLLIRFVVVICLVIIVVVNFIQIGYTPLHYASYNGNSDVVELLLDSAVNFDLPAKVMNYLGPHAALHQE